MMLTATTELISRLKYYGHHRRTLQDYLGRCPVLREDQYGPKENMAIEEAWAFLAKGPGHGPCKSLPVPGLDDIEPVIMGELGRDLLLREGDEIIGGIFNYLPLVPEAQRGRGIGTLLVLISDLNGARFLRPYGYSEAGFRARCGAHREQVRIALEGGLFVPDAVLAQYRFNAGEPGLVLSWGVSEQNALAACDDHGVLPPFQAPDPSHDM